MAKKFLVYGLLMVLHAGLLRATVNEITSVEEYKKVKDATKPTIIVFNSASCSACTMMEPFINAASENPDYQDVDFWRVDTQNEALKELPKLEKILAYPTTFFIKPGKEPRRERGCMSEKEVNDIVYELVHGKRRPLPPAPKKASPKKVSKPAV